MNALLKVIYRIMSNSSTAHTAQFMTSSALVELLEESPAEVPRQRFQATEAARTGHLADFKLPLYDRFQWICAHTSGIPGPLLIAMSDRIAEATASTPQGVLICCVLQYSPFWSSGGPSRPRCGIPGCRERIQHAEAEHH